MLLHVGAFLIPASQRLDRKAVTKIVQPRAMAVREPSQADLAGELDKGSSYRTRDQPRALLGDEKAGTAWDRVLLVPSLYIALKCLLSTGMQRQPARFTKLGVADC